MLKRGRFTGAWILIRKILKATALLFGIQLVTVAFGLSLVLCMNGAVLMKETNGLRIKHVISLGIVVFPQFGMGCTLVWLGLARSHRRAIRKSLISFFQGPLDL